MPSISQGALTNPEVSKTFAELHRQETKNPRTPLRPQMQRSRTASDHLVDWQGISVGRSNT